MKPIINAVLFAVVALVIVIMWPFIGTSHDEEDRDD
jgi:hypothetical protein